MLWTILGTLISYLIGSIPTAYIFVRLIKGADIRKFGSGNVGATNALRILGKRIGVTVLLLDIVKGFIAVFFIGNFLGPRIIFINGEILRVILGAACISGHIWTVFLSFKGGKGVATTLGVLIALAVKTNGLPIVIALTLVTWAIIFIVSKFVSLASIIAAISLPIYMYLFRQSALLIATGIILSAIVIFRHKANLKRLREGKENAFF